MEGMIICTRVAGKLPDMNLLTGDSWRYLPQSQIVALDHSKPEEPFKVLTVGYYSARSPQISFDGKFMLFTAQQKQNETWQIWEMDLGNFKARMVTSSRENCTDPAYLPGGRMVFSKAEVNDPLKAGNSLYTCNPDGSDIRRITFNPHTYFAPVVLKDGRVLTISRQLYPRVGDPMFMILRPDGTKAELFYKGSEKSELLSGVCETTSGKIIFVENEKGDPQRGNLISINYNRPLHSRENLSTEIQGDFRSVFAQSSGKLLASYRKSESDRYALYEFDPENNLPGKAIYISSEYDILEAVDVAKHDRPRKLPSEVDMGVKTGQLLCQDITISAKDPGGSNPLSDKASRIEVMGIDSTLGVVQVEEDGSFYLKILADKPFQIRKIDQNGKVLNDPCGWIWLRPNERRGCVGCHEDQEQVPANIIPKSVKKLPVIIPVHSNKVSEKKITLE